MDEDGSFRGRYIKEWLKTPNQWPLQNLVQTKPTFSPPVSDMLTKEELLPTTIDLKKSINIKHLKYVIIMIARFYVIFILTYHQAVIGYLRLNT